MSASRAVLSAIRRLTENGPVRVSVAEIAKVAGVHRVTCVRTINELVDRGLVQREGTARSVCTYSIPTTQTLRPVLPPRADDGTKDWEEDEEGGQEYTEVQNFDVALRDRCLWAARHKSGPKWMRKRGEMILQGIEPPPFQLR